MNSTQDETSDSTKQSNHLSQLDYISLQNQQQPQELNHFIGTGNHQSSLAPSFSFHSTSDPMLVNRSASTLPRGPLHLDPPATIQFASPAQVCFDLSQDQEALTEKSPPRNPCFGERERFLLFVKVLFRYLEKTNNHRMRQRAKTIVSECTRRNRMGDMNYSPLKEAVENRLKDVLGEEFWARIQEYFEYICQSKGLFNVEAV